MPEIDQSSGAPRGTRAVHVDVSSLDAFAAAVEAELQANFLPLTGKLTKVYGNGSHFGIGHASPDVALAQQRHNQCLRAAVRQLGELAQATQVLVDAARTVAARYRGSDAMASASFIETLSALSDAASAAGANVGAEPNGVPPSVADDGPATDVSQSGTEGRFMA
jgi:hypothetical protein